MNYDEAFVAHMETVEANLHIRTERIVCRACLGAGTSTAYLGSYTEEDRAAMGDEWHDFQDDVRNGLYDRQCEHCNGLRVETQVVQEALPADVMDQYIAFMEEAYYNEQTERMERMMGA